MLLNDTLENNCTSAESEITVKFAKLSEAVNENNQESVTALATELVILIGDRNKKCKLLK